MPLLGPESDGLLIKPEVAVAQQEPRQRQRQPGRASLSRLPAGQPVPIQLPAPAQSQRLPHPSQKARRFHGAVTLDTTRVGRDASQIADEVIAHLAGLVGAKVTVTLEIEAEIPSGAPDHVVRTVTENSRTLKFSSQGFERE